MTTGAADRHLTAACLAVGVLLLVFFTSASAGQLSTGALNGRLAVATSTGRFAAAAPDQSESCSSSNPRYATVCYPIAGSTAARNSRTPAVVMFRDTPTGRPEVLARSDEVGSLWGLAFDPEANKLYASAYHKRGIPFGPAGPGAIYRVDLASGDIQLFAQVPNPGDDEHSPGRLPMDPAGRNFVGKTSLGDIDLHLPSQSLFVMNLLERRIYRLSLLDGSVLDSFEVGSANTAWAGDGRPFALGVRGDQVYHGVVNTSETMQDRALLRATVYASDLAGGNMRTVAEFGLDASRGTLTPPPAFNGHSPPNVPIDWLPWQDGYHTVNRDQERGLPGPAVFPQPMLTDIQFAGEDLFLGLRDRFGDMTFDWLALTHGRVNLPLGEQGAIPVGDILRGERSAGTADTWTVDPTGPQPDDGDSLSPENAFGGLAYADGRSVVSTHWFASADDVGGQVVPWAGALWFDLQSLQRVRHEEACAPMEIVEWNSGQPFPGFADGTRGGRFASSGAEPSHNSYLVPLPSVGDVEPICRPDEAPTATPSPTTPSPSVTFTPSATVTSSPTTATASPTVTSTARPTRTPTPSSIYLPSLSHHNCLKPRPPIDVVLVFDVSTSMLQAAGTEHSKIEEAEEAARAFLALLRLAAPESGALDRVAVVGFNRESWVAADLTSSEAVLLDAINKLRERMSEGTRLDLAFTAGRVALEGTETDRLPAVVVLTDGRPNLVPLAEDGTMETTVLRAADGLKATGATVFTIGLGDGSQIDVPLLEAAASSPDHFLHAPDSGDLKRMYEVIVETLECQ